MLCFHFLGVFQLSGFVNDISIPLVFHSVKLNKPSFFHILSEAQVNAPITAAHSFSDIMKRWPKIVGWRKGISKTKHNHFYNTK